MGSARYYRKESCQCLFRAAMDAAIKIAHETNQSVA
jgi:hypothetical protein